MVNISPKNKDKNLLFLKLSEL